MRIYSRDVCMHVHVSHAQKCQFALMLRKPGVTDMCIAQVHQGRTELGGGHFLAMEDGVDSVTGPLKCLAEWSAETRAEPQQMTGNS